MWSFIVPHWTHNLNILLVYSASSNVACGVSQHFTSNYQLLEQFADFKLQSGRLSAEKLLWLLGYIVTLCCAWNKNLLLVMQNMAASITSNHTFVQLWQIAPVPILGLFHGDARQQYSSNHRFFD